jgi:hypothetical protein
MVTEELKPAVPKNWLLALAGLMWSAVGAFLCWLAYGWLADIHKTWACVMGLVGMALALVAYRFGFSRIAHSNIERIRLAPEMACLFSFQAWRGYLTIALMIILGILLRSSQIPKYYLAIPYTMIGGALLLASLLYYSRLWQITVKKRD